MSQSRQQQNQHQYQHQHQHQHQSRLSRLSLTLHHTDRMLSLIRRLSSTRQASTTPPPKEQTAKEGEEGEEVRDSESEGGTFDEDADPRDPATYYTFPKFQKPSVDGDDQNDQENRENEDRTSQPHRTNLNDVESLAPDRTSTSGTSTPTGHRVNSLTSSRGGLVKETATPPFWPESPRRNLQRRESAVAQRSPTPTPSRGSTRRTSSYTGHFGHSLGAEQLGLVVRGSALAGDPTMQGYFGGQAFDSIDGQALGRGVQGQVLGSPGRLQRSSVSGYGQQSGLPKGASLIRRASEQPGHSSTQRLKENEGGS